MAIVIDHNEIYRQVAKQLGYHLDDELMIEKGAAFMICCRIIFNLEEIFI